jgi:hypothetical protein
MTISLLLEQVNTRNQENLRNIEILKIIEN